MHSTDPWWEKTEEEQRDASLGAILCSHSWEPAETCPSLLPW